MPSPPRPEPSLRASCEEAASADPWPIEIAELAPHPLAEVIVPSAIEIVPKPAKPKREKTQGEKNIRKIEDELFFEACAVLADMLRFKQIDEKEETVPEEWVKKWGEKKAAEVFRVAKSAWRSKKEAPIALSEATQIVGHIMRARAKEAAGPAVLNMNMVSMNFALPTFPERKVDR